MATEYYRLRTVSMLDLTKSSGYLQDPDAVTEEALEEVLRANPELISSWLNLSDARTRYGWCLSKPHGVGYEGDGWVVEYPNGKKKRHFPDGFTACAFYVKQEIECYRELISDAS